MIIEDSFTQGSDEWFKARCGNPGASNFSKIITSTGNPSKQAQDYLFQLAGEFVAGQAEETFNSVHMENGLERESAARMLFEMIQDVSVRQVGICYKDEAKKFHASPDGLIGEDSGLELKNPMLKTHVNYLLNKKIKPVKDGFYDNVVDSVRYMGELFYRPLSLNQDEGIMELMRREGQVKEATQWGWMEGTK